MSRFLKTYFYFLFSGVVMISAVPVLFLFRAGEYLPLEEVTKRQLESSAKLIYGTAIFKNTAYYKKLLLEGVSPRIVVLGSSRVLQFRQHMFLSKFVNLGRAMTSIAGGLDIINEILAKDPDIVLIGVDYWWFNDKYEDPKITYIAQENKNAIPTPRHVLRVYEWLYDKKITISKMLHTIAFGAEDIGVAGQEKDGFGPDGSYYYTRRVMTGIERNDILFQDTLGRIENGTRKFQYNSSANQIHVENFVRLVGLLEERGIEVVVFFPPFANVVNERLRAMKGKYDYFEDVKIKLQKNGIESYDYTDATIVDSPDCEFLDGFHGGEITYMRILRDLASKVPTLNNYVDLHILDGYIQKGSGMAFYLDKEISNEKEVDFLGLGCSKH